MAKRARDSRSPRRQRHHYNGYSEFYSPSSEAYDVYNIPYERHNRPKFEPRIVANRKKVKRKRASSKKPRFLIDMNNRTRAAFMPYVALSVFFIGVIAVVFCGVRIIEMRMEINALAREHQELQSSNLLKSAQLARSHDLREIELLATTRLGMVTPAQHQIIHISVPRQNYVVQNLAVQDDDEGVFSRISSFSRRVFAMAALW
ncbi:MAG: hypothetical protein FWE29_02950 [Defluviitaleaceae bacterium]|nr:hypothetical protein [Defluviitaleaceae bacterium]